MRWVGWLAVGVGGCTWNGGVSVDAPDTGTADTDPDTDVDTGVDTGATTPQPCPWAGAWQAAAHDCEEADTFETSATLGPDCVLWLELVRVYEDGSTNPPVCVTTEYIALEYTEAEDLWSATSLEQDSAPEKTCYGSFVGLYPLGPVAIALDGPDALTIDFSPAPWSLSECSGVQLRLTR